MNDRIQRSDTDKLIAGVCGGLAAYFGIDPVLVRLAFVVVSAVWGSGLLVYVVLAVIMPRPGSTGSTAETVRRNIDELSDQAHERADALRQTWRTADRRRRRTIFALALIAVGLLMLGGQFGVFMLLTWAVVAPVLMVLLGIAILLGVFGRPDA